MDDTDRDVLERCREYQSYLGTLEGYGCMPDIVDVIRDAADEIEHQRKLLGAAKDTAVELAMGIRSAYQSELERLRKIESAARDYVCQLVADVIWGDLDYTDAWGTPYREKLAALRTSLEIDDD